MIVSRAAGNRCPLSAPKRTFSSLEFNGPILSDSGSAHGLRKAGAAIAAENGVTASQLMAIFGWKIIAEAERYTKAADRKRMTQENMHLIRRRDENVPPKGVVQKVGPKWGLND